MEVIMQRKYPPTILVRYVRKPSILFPLVGINNMPIKATSHDYTKIIWVLYNGLLCTAKTDLLARNAEIFIFVVKTLAC